MIINVKKTDIDDKKLGHIQKHQEELQYTMREYIAYIISNYEEIKTKILERSEAKKQEASKDITFRTAEMLAGLYVGYSIFIDFAIANGVITLEEKDKMLREAWKILLELGKEQNMMVETESPMNMLLSAIEVSTNTGKLTTVDYKDAKYMKQQDVMKDGFIRFL